VRPLAEGVTPALAGGARGENANYAPPPVCNQSG